MSLPSRSYAMHDQLWKLVLLTLGTRQYDRKRANGSASSKPLRRFSTRQPRCATLGAGGANRYDEDRDEWNDPLDH